MLTPKEIREIRAEIRKLEDENAELLDWLLDNVTSPNWIDNKQVWNGREIKIVKLKNRLNERKPEQKYMQEYKVPKKYR